jgi:hypothetical protein
MEMRVHVHLALSSDLGCDTLFPHMTSVALETFDQMFVHMFGCVSLLGHLPRVHCVSSDVGWPRKPGAPTSCNFNMHEMSGREHQLWISCCVESTPSCVNITLTPASLVVDVWLALVVPQIVSVCYFIIIGVPSCYAHMGKRASSFGGRLLDQGHHANTLSGELACCLYIEQSTQHSPSYTLWKLPAGY